MLRFRVILNKMTHLHLEELLLQLHDALTNLKKKQKCSKTTVNITVFQNTSDQTNTLSVFLLVQYPSIHCYNSGLIVSHLLLF